MKHLWRVTVCCVGFLLVVAGCAPATTPPPPIEDAVTLEAVPQSILVRYERGVPANVRAETRAAANSRLVREYRIVPRLELLETVDTDAALRSLQRLPTVEYAEPNYIVSIDQTVPDDPSYNDLWGMANINAPQAWDLSTGDPDFVVAIIDTGIDYNHPDLAANIWVNPGEIAGNGIDDDANGYVDDIHGWDWVSDDNDPMDDHFHGTHTGGTVGAVGNNKVGVTGVNWNIELAALKFLSASGSGSTGDAISALEYAVDMGFQISNNSWGGDGYSQGLYDAIQNARLADHLFIAAAGNSGKDNDADPNYPSGYELDNIIAVAAIDQNDQLANFSNYGARTVDLAAPGMGILSTVLNGNYSSYNGTSMATPHVAGAAALILSMNPDWSFAQVRDQLLATARPLDQLSGRVKVGGTLDAFAALDAQEPGPVPTAAPTPVPPTATPSLPFISVALKDIPMLGRVRGEYTDTWERLGGEERITERFSRGRAANRVDFLEHRWEFAIPDNRPKISFHVSAWATESTDGDKMSFEYSTDNIRFTPMFMVEATSSSDEYQEFVLPDTVRGKTLYIRVRDTDRTAPSRQALDSIYIDHMYITSEMD